MKKGVAGSQSPAPSTIWARVTPAERWRFALKPASWPKLLVPMALGQAIGIDATGRLSLGGLAVGAAFTLLDLAFVVLLNDWGDQDVDRIKRTMFPATSKKTIPDGVLPSRAVLAAGAIAGALAVAVAVAGEVALGRSGFALGALAALGIFAAYTLPPLRLNYRGGGELLEALGVGVVLPWLNAYAQSGDAAPPGLVVLPGFAILALASAVASGLADERSDRRGGKRTVVTMVGNRLARRTVEVLALAGGVAWVVTGWVDVRGVAAIPIWGAAGVALLSWSAMWQRSEAATTDAFDAQREYKAALHRLVWESSLFLAGGLALGPLIGW
jgi:1,4-dihydroxy-2-naphthoate octaprenyltransferase/chlorophyll synthase